METPVCPPSDVGQKHQKGALAPRQGRCRSRGQPCRAGHDCWSRAGLGMTPLPPDALDHQEPHEPGMARRLNWLRAGVLGSNDGIVSTAGLVIGVAGATTQLKVIVTAGIAGLAAGAMSMAVGEYVSVSSQRDSEHALLTMERRELEETPEEELEELTDLYATKGLTRELAKDVAIQLTAHDALGAHAEAELGIDPDNLTSPTHASVASFIAFTLGSLLPLLAIAFPRRPGGSRSRWPRLFSRWPGRGCWLRAWARLRSVGRCG